MSLFRIGTGSLYLVVKWAKNGVQKIEVTLKRGPLTGLPTAVIHPYYIIQQRRGHVSTDFPDYACLSMPRRRSVALERHRAPLGRATAPRPPQTAALGYHGECTGAEAQLRHSAPQGICFEYPCCFPLLFLYEFQLFRFLSVRHGLLLARRAKGLTRT